MALTISTLRLDKNGKIPVDYLPISVLNVINRIGRLELKIGTFLEVGTAGQFILSPKGTAFNKDFGTTAGTVVEGNDPRLDISASLNIEGTPFEILVDDTDPALPIISLALNPVIPGVQKVTIPAGTTAQRPTAPQDGDLRLNKTTDQVECYIDGGWVDFVTSSTATNLNNIILNETPTGSINGINLVFSTIYNYRTNSTQLFMNGIRMKLGDDYTELGTNQIQFIIGSVPFTNDSLIIDYIKN